MFDRGRALVNQQIAIFLGWSLRFGWMGNLYADIINPQGERVGSAKIAHDGLAEYLTNGEMWPDFLSIVEERMQPVNRACE